MAARLCSVGLIVLQVFGVRLHDFRAFKKEQIQLVLGDPGRKGFGMIKGGEKPSCDVLPVNRLLHWRIRHSTAE
jgi:hypothetical protein